MVLVGSLPSLTLLLGGPETRVLDKTYRLKQDNPSFGTHLYRGGAAGEYTASVFMHPMEVKLGFELEHQLSWVQSLVLAHGWAAAVCQRDRMVEVPYIWKGLE